MTLYSSNWFMLLLPCASAPFSLCCDQFDHGSTQAKRELVDLATEDYDVSLCQQISNIEQVFLYFCTYVYELCNLRCTKLRATFLPQFSHVSNWVYTTNCNQIQNFFYMTIYQIFSYFCTYVYELCSLLCTNTFPMWNPTEFTLSIATEWWYLSKYWMNINPHLCL